MFNFEQIENWVNHNAPDVITEKSIAIMINTFISEFNLSGIKESEKFEPGDVFQINQNHGRNGWVGAFVLSTEIKKWGIKGFVHVIKTQDEMGCAFIRLGWEEIDYIGPSVLISKGEQNGKQ